MMLKEFLNVHPKIKCDIGAKPNTHIDFQKLHEKILNSRFLQGTRSLAWLCRNYDKIINDKYEDYPKGVAPEQFGNERTYDKEFFKDFYTPMSAIDW